MAPEPRILVAGETLIDFVPETIAPLETVECFKRRAGGAPANVAVGLAKLKETPWLWTRIGGDRFGTFLDSTLAAYELPARFIERDESAKTTLAFVGHNEDGDAEFSFYREDTADTRFETGRIPDGVLDTVEIVYAGGIVLSADPARAAIFELLDRAQKQGCRIFFDPNTRPELWTDGESQPVIERALARADIVATSTDDLMAIGWPGSIDRLLDKLLASGPHTAFLTKGEVGAVVKTTDRAPWGEQRYSHAGFAVDAVDPTGAGDAFAAAVLAGLVESDGSLQEILQFANAVGALATTTSGGMAAMPTQAAVTAFLAERSDESE
ncbi:MAG: carbohydrate kinase [Halobacteriales archaeon]|nr:carbohydrate kinase [Halobacteriales archaeon]